MSLRKTIRIEIHKLKELPPLTGSTQEILIAVNNPDIHVEELCHVLEESPPLVARLLSLANSAYFGYPGTVNSIRHAIIRVLGLNIVKSLTIGILLSDALDIENCPLFDNQRFWFTSVATANLSQKFCSLISEKEAIDPATAYSSGLLCNIGLLALVHKFPEAMNMVFKEVNSGDRRVNSVLKENFDLDQYESGAWLAQRWNLPQSIATVIAFNRNNEYDGPYSTNARLVGICSGISETVYSTPEIELNGVNRFEALSIPCNIAREVLHDFQQRIDELHELAAALSIHK